MTCSSVLHRVRAFCQSGRRVEEQQSSDTWNQLLSWRWVYRWERPLTNEQQLVLGVTSTQRWLSVCLFSVFWGHGVGSVASRLAEERTRFQWGAGGSDRPQEDPQAGAVRQVQHSITRWFLWMKWAVGGAVVPWWLTWKQVFTAQSPTGLEVCSL